MVAIAGVDGEEDRSDLDNEHTEDRAGVEGQGVL